MQDSGGASTVSVIIGGGREDESTGYGPDTVTTLTYVDITSYVQQTPTPVPAITIKVETGVNIGCTAWLIVECTKLPVAPS